MLKNIFKTPDMMEPTTRLRSSEEELSDCAAGDWRGCWSERCDVAVGDDTFNVYTAGERQEGRPMWVLLHGGGHTALVWSLVAQRLAQSSHYVLAYDSRGHGATRTAQESNLAVQQQVADCNNVLTSFFAGAEVPPFVLVGHSMGGAIAVHVACSSLLERSLRGLIVIDVVEGTALEALPQMRRILSGRPTCFASEAQAIRWALDSNTVRNRESARLSVPSQLRRRADDAEKWEWRTDLFATEEHWRGWFENLSALFLSCKVPKMLVLAGTDRLDTPLTVGQMQGKYQLVLLPQCTHQIHEDSPDVLAEKLTHFYTRNFARP